MTQVDTAQSPDSQAMEERYRQAQAILQGYTTTSLVQNDTVFPHWIVDSNEQSMDIFWYERAHSSGKEYRLVDAKNASNTIAFDHALFANALAIASNQEINAQDLPISHIGMMGSPLTVSFTAFSQRWQYSVEKQVCQIFKKSTLNAGEALSPNGKRVAFARDYNLWVRDVSTGKEQALTLDGTSDFAYAVAGSAWGGQSSIIAEQIALWSPDSSQLLTVKRDKREVCITPSVASIPSDGNTRPQLNQVKIANSGDKHIEIFSLLAINVDTGESCYADYAPMPACVNEYHGFFESKLAFWAENSQQTYYIDQEQGDQIVRLVEFNTRTGGTRVLFEETSETQINILPDAMALAVHQFLPKSKELI